MCLHASPYLDSSNIKQFLFEERGKPLEFIDDEMRGGMYCQMLDCEHNRKFLASMLGYKFWEIEEPEVLADITARAAEITRSAVIVKPNQPKETKMSDIEIETEMARLQAEKSKRTVEKAEGSKRKPAPEPVVETVTVLSKEGPLELPASSISNDTTVIPDPTPEPPEQTRVRGKPAKRRKSSLATIGG
jgi:hypothetical protein